MEKILCFPTQSKIVTISVAELLTMIRQACKTSYLRTDDPALKFLVTRFYLDRIKPVPNSLTVSPSKDRLCLQNVKVLEYQIGVIG